jgi:hypothetical protein
MEEKYCYFKKKMAFDLGLSISTISRALNILISIEET